MNDRRPPRFPYVAALLCAACVGAAGWTWMSYSYCWELPPEKWESQEPLILRRPPSPQQLRACRIARNALYARVGRYVRVKGTIIEQHSTAPLRRHGWGVIISAPRASILVYSVLNDEAPGGLHDTLEFRGRVVGGVWAYAAIMIDAGASRFHGASIAGLAVGAMGVFVFAVALRHWLGERRNLREEARA